MKKFDNLTSNIVFAGQVLLLFLLFFEAGVSLPPWVQVLGRMHPLLLHLPIGFWVLLGILRWSKGRWITHDYDILQSFLLQLTALTATATALMGFFLSQEEGYAGDVLFWHKWTGVALSLLTYGLLIAGRYDRPARVVYPILLSVGLLLLVVTGHFGASLTHGEDFLWAPVRPAAAPVTEATPLFDAAVVPILTRRCTACHNERKAKGGLVMTSAERLLSGGKNGPVWVAGDPLNSTILHRLTLPLDHEEHMPPTGKPQLSEAEVRLLHAWIAGGAEMDRPLGDYPPQDTLRQLAERLLSERPATEATVRYDFQPAAGRTIRQLNTAFRTVAPLAAGSPALHAEIFVKETYQPTFLSELLAVKEQLVSLNLSNLPIRDDDLATIARFTSLRKLILNGTLITGAGLSQLTSCLHLESLALAATDVEPSQLPDLDRFPALRELFLWDTPFTPNETAQLAQRYPDITFSMGYIPDKGELLPLSPPQIVNKATVLAPGENIEIRHNLAGTVIRYTTDGADPDSLTSPVYEQPIEVSSYTVLKARAFRDQWLSSSTVIFTFFPHGITPKQATLLHPPDPQYRGSGPPTLTDGAKGDAANFRSPAWLGFREQSFAALVDLGESPPRIGRITLSYALNIGSYVMPPQSAEVWGGTDPEHLSLLKRITPEQPSGYQPNQVRGLEMTIPPSSFRYYKVVATPVPRLPAWHSGKGDKGWVFVDEVLFN